VGLKAFTKSVKAVRDEGRDCISMVAAGIHRLQRTSGRRYSDEFLDRWLDGFLLSRIGSNMILDQYVACASLADGGKGREMGIIDRNCNLLAVCERAASQALQLCQVQTGRKPVFTIESYQAGAKGAPFSFSYAPGCLRYIMVELLKNSFKATVENALDERDLQKRPIHVLVCCDEQRVAIRVSDRAGGIPLDVGDRIWSYLYGAAARSSASTAPTGAPDPTPLSGYGVGLPLSRLHAKYLGGRLDVTSYPGYGTDASLLLPRLDADQLEQVPDGSLFGAP